MIEFGDCRETMRRWKEQGVKAQTCVTSPPYYGLRSYLPDVVKMKASLSEEDRSQITEELKNIGVNPVNHTLDAV